MKKKNDAKTKDGKKTVDKMRRGEKSEEMRDSK